MVTVEDRTALVHIGSVEEVHAKSPLVETIGRRTVVIWATEDGIFALDNRCPHMGFPLNRGTVHDGILTCHWHHAKFDLAGGCTFDPFADDVAAFRGEPLGDACSDAAARSGNECNLAGQCQVHVPNPVVNKLLKILDL